MPFLVDTNVLTDARRRYYGMDFCPGFWDLLWRAQAAGNVHSIKRVGDELARGHDELANWSRSRKEFFHTAPAGVNQSYEALSNWVASQPYTPAARNEFFRAADYEIVAHAHATRAIVVSNEIATPNARSRITIPDACNALQVGFQSVWQMLRALEAHSAQQAAPTRRA
ncbi:MAG TPA: DUF4411 family protein [Terriglobales bacterium]|nr:DUF4411 family protein [Terriglobales bacterium]